MNLLELNLRVKMVIESVEGIVTDCTTSDELEVVATTLGFLLASMTTLDPARKAAIYKVGLEAKIRISKKEKEDENKN